MQIGKEGARVTAKPTPQNGSAKTQQIHASLYSNFLFNHCSISAMSHRKRKYRQRSDRDNTHNNNQYDLVQASSLSSIQRPTDHSLFIVAHEADIVRGPQAARSADSLEVGINVDGRGGSRIGEGLIKWESKVGSGGSSHWHDRDRDAEGGMWVDRYVISLWA